MSRSLKKGFYVHPKLMDKVLKAQKENSLKPIQTWARGSTITPEFIGLKFSVHTGKTFVEVLVTENMVGHKLGEFAPTRIFKGHAGIGKK